MAFDSSHPVIDFERDVRFTADIKGDSLLVFWRGVPVGYVSCYQGTPRINRHLSADARAEIRDKFRLLQGKWGSIQLSEICDSKEKAAELLIVQQISKSEQSPLMQAALRNDAAEVSRLLNLIASRK